MALGQRRRGGRARSLPTAILPFAMGALLILVARPGPAQGQEEGVSAVQLTAEQVQERIEEVQALPELSETARSQALENYRNAVDMLQKARQHRTREEELRHLRETAPEKLKAIEEELAEPPPEVEVEPPEDASLAELEQSLTEAEAALTARQEELAELEAEPTRRAQRRAEIPEEISRAEEELAGVHARLQEQPEQEQGEPPRSKRVLLGVQERELQARISALKAELLSYDARRQLLEARRLQAERELQLAEKRAEAWREMVNRRRREQAAEDVQQARRMAAEAHPSVQKIAARNEELARLRTGPDGLVTELERASRQLQQINARRTELQADFTRIKDRIQEIDLTKAISALLRRKRAELPDIHTYRRKITGWEEELSEVQLKLLEIETQQDRLGDVQDRTDEMMGGLDSALGEQERREVRQTVEELLRNRAALLTSLKKDYEAYSDALLDLKQSAERLVELTKQYANYIDEKILWFRSTSPLGREHLVGTWAAIRWMGNPSAWARLGKALGADAASSPALWALMAVALGVLIRLRGRLKAWRERSAELVGEVSTDAFRHTLATLGITVALAAWWPLVLWFIGWRAAETPRAGQFAAAVGSALRQTALIWATLAFLRQAAASDGLVHAHFRWTDRTAALLRRHLGWFIPLASPLLFVYLASSWNTDPSHADSLGRLALCALMLTVAGFFWRILHPRSGVPAEMLSRKEGGWLDRLRVVWFPLSLLVPVALAVAAVLGYQYTAHELAVRLLWTAWLVFGVLILYQLLLRWLFVARRRLALERARKRREEQEEPEATTPEGAPVPTEEAEVSLHVIGSQTRSLLRTVMALGFVVGLWLVWNPLLPALGMLSAVNVWPGLSLAEIGGAIIVVVVTVIAARNLPGLLEIALLQQLPIEPGVRFAISAICRYVIIIIGIVMAGQAIGIGWEKVQWLAAAVTVGLGFGLQEIFANFVSGLIILLERPMRVGDVVTVGEVTGTVSRIRMRASTITDWDRKELVVPNKEFITGRLINWSLSDRVLRVVIAVGIAYGSDTQKARDLLLQVAREHPDVLSDPEPSALFLGFGASSLNFELRVFIPTVDVRLRVQHDLHMAVDRAFRQAGIVIAFPQQDVHLDMAEGPLQIEQVAQSAEDENAGE